MPGASPFSRLTRLDLEDLVGLAGGAEPRATEEVLRRLRPMMIRYCRARLGRVGGAFDRADELAQETCVAVLAALPRYRSTHKPFTAVAFGVAARTVDRYRMRASRTAHAGTRRPERGRARRKADRARALLDELPEDLCHLLVLRTAVGLSTAETGRALSMSPGAVCVAQHRAVTRLRALVSRLP